MTTLTKTINYTTVSTAQTRATIVENYINNKRLLNLFVYGMCLLGHRIDNALQCSKRQLGSSLTELYDVYL